MRATVPNIREIVLHAYDIDIISYNFNPLLPEIPFNASSYDPVHNMWTIPVPSTFNGGLVSEIYNTTLTVQYVGYMRDDMYGFYRSYYVENGKKVWMGTTQFQPDHARRAFPCFDVSENLQLRTKPGHFKFSVQEISKI